MCEPTNLTSKTNHSQAHQDSSSVPAHFKSPCSPLGLPHSPLQVQDSTETPLHPPEPCASPPVQFCCSDCPRTTARKRELRHHILRCHFPQQTEQKCALCPGSFNSFSVLRLHYERAHPASPPPPGVLFLCDLCSAAYTCEAGLRYHVARTHPAHMSCILCLCHTDGRPNQVFTYMTELKSHYYDTHRLNAEGAEVYRLLACRLVTDKIRNIVALDKLYNCDICQKVAFRTKLELRDHILASHYNLFRFYCRYCAYIAGSKKEILKHNSRKHVNKDKTVFREVSDITECLELFEMENWEHKRFETFVASRFCNHMSSVHGVRSGGSYKNIVRKEACQRRFSSNMDLLQHFSEHHLSDMICEICHREIFEGLVLVSAKQEKKELPRESETHEIRSLEETKSVVKDGGLKIVEQEHNVPMENAETLMRRKKLLQRYLPEWQYLEYCSVLGKINNQACNREAVCFHCFKVFPDVTRLASHMRSVHLGMSRPWCAQCGQKFQFHVDLEQHWRRAHDSAVQNAIRETLGGNFLDSETYKTMIERELSFKSHTKAKHTARFQCVPCALYYKSSKIMRHFYQNHSDVQPSTVRSVHVSGSETNSITQNRALPDSPDIMGEQGNSPTSSVNRKPELVDGLERPKEKRAKLQPFAENCNSPVPAKNQVFPPKKAEKEMPFLEEWNNTRTPSFHSKRDSEEHVDIPLNQYKVRSTDVKSIKFDTYQYKEALELIQNIKRNQDESYSCYICLQKFRDIPQIKYHILKTHLDLGGFSCASCDFKAYTVAEVAGHTRESHPTSRLFCRMRIDTTKDPEPIDANLVKQMLYPCKFCNMRFHSVTSLKLHVEKEHLYVESQPLPCTMHEYIMNTLQNHYEVQHPLQITNISVELRCNTEYCSIYDLEMHIDAYHKSKCKYCGFDVFQEAGEDTLEICLSMWKLENMVEALTPVRKEDGLYNCPLCDSHFGHYQKFRDHVLCDHFDVINYKCSDCSFLGYNAPGMARHIGGSHKEKQKATARRVLGKAPYLSWRENFKSYKCDTCKKRFHTFGELRGHMASHRAEDCEPRDCDVLGKFSLQPQNTESANQNQPTQHREC